MVSLKDATIGDVPPLPVAREACEIPLHICGMLNKSDIY